MSACTFRPCAPCGEAEQSALLLLLRSYDHALDPESGSVDEVGGCHQVFLGAPQLVSQRCPNWPVPEVLLLRAGGSEDCNCKTCSGVCESVSHGQVSVCDRGQDCKTCSGVCESVSHGQVSVCDRGQDCKTCSGVCESVTQGQFSVCDRPRRRMWARRRQCPVRSLNTAVCWWRSSRWMGWVLLSVAVGFSPG